jgi:hypothetical protein
MSGNRILAVVAKVLVLRRNAQQGGGKEKSRLEGGGFSGRDGIN